MIKSINVNGQRLNITTNLHDALPQIRSMATTIRETLAELSQELLLRVDAICIDQSKKREQTSLEWVAFTPRPLRLWHGSAVPII